MKLIGIIFLTCLHTLPVMAKGGNNKKINWDGIGKAPLAFNIHYYYSLNNANRIKYLQEINQLMMKMEKENLSKRKSAQWNFFDVFNLTPAADAANFLCMQGGITFESSSKCNNTLPSELSDTVAFSCGSGEARCSLAAGISESGKGYCYPNTPEYGKKATTHCFSLGGTSAVERLAAKLNQCAGSLETNCQQMISLLEKDTANLEKYCESRSQKKHCIAARKDIQKLSPYIANLQPANDGKPIDSKGSIDGCSSAKSDVLGGEIEKILGAKPDKKWLKLMEVAEKGCGQGTSMDGLLSKFGACRNKNGDLDVEADIAKPKSNMLRSAIGKIINPSVGKIGHDEVQAFQEYFGVTPSEFQELFCKSDANNYYMKLVDLNKKITTPSNSKLSDVEILSKFLDASDLKERIDKIPQDRRTEHDKMYANLQKYAGLVEGERAKRKQLELLNESCRSGNAMSCEEARNLDIPYNSEAVKTRIDLMEYLTSFPKSSDKKEGIDKNWGGYVSKSLLGKELHAQAASERKKELESTFRGELTGEAYKRRNEFFSCALEGMGKAKKDGPLVQEYARSNLAEKSCRRIPVTKIDGKKSYGDIYIETPNAGCYKASSKLVSTSACKDKAAIEIPEYKRDPVCLDEIASLGTAYTYKCGTSSPNDTYSPDAGSIGF